MKQLILLLAIQLFVLFTNAQIVNIPDPVFKTFLVSDSLINTNTDTEIQLNEANGYSGVIHISGYSIFDLTGIEYFTSIVSLQCMDTYIDSIDVSNNQSIELINCFSVNSLKKINANNCTSLKEIWASSSNISSLNVNNCISLEKLDLCFNQLITLDLSTCYSFVYLSSCSNQLISLNVKNGNNSNFINFHAPNNPNLLCIEVDNVAWSTTNWTDKDSIASFSEDCSIGVSNEVQITNLSVYPNPTTGKINITNAENSSVYIYNIMDELVKTVSQFTESINISNLPNGNYIVKLIKDSAILYEKIILIK